MAKKTWKKPPKKRIRTSRSKPKPSPTRDVPVHSWRVCPYGQHQVIEHPKNNPPSKTHPGGSVSTVHWHCAHNPSGKDQLYPDEIRKMSTQHFSDLETMPCPLALGFANGDSYDDLIAGWTQYWNDILKPAPLLDPNLVKALIATESRFIPNLLADKKKQNSACGLMQITNGTRKILDNLKGEIKDYYITATREELNDPSINICAGIRWLFRKRAWASNNLGHEASWEEAVSAYKGTSLVSKERAKELMDRFREKYEALKKCKKR